MSCPRCGGPLATFTVETTDGSADACESCGFVGVSASHRAEGDETESWDRARERFDETVLPPERTCRTERGESVTAPADGSGSALDATRLEEAVSVGTSLRGVRNEENEETG